MRHMSQPAPKHMKAMLHCMKHCTDRSNRGLVLKPDTKWDGSKDFAFTIAGRSDSNYAKEPVTRRSVSESSVKLNGAPVMFKSGTQRHVALSMTEVELYAAVNCAHDMLYCMHVLQSLGLTVNLPMILEVDNQGELC